MLSRIWVLSLLVTFPGAVCAQTASTPGNPPVPASDTELAPLPPAADTPAPAPSDSALDQPITKIAGTTSGCAVLDKDFPGLRTHPMYAFFKSMTLNQIAAMSHGRITQEMLVQAQTDLAGLAAQAGASAALPVAAAPPAAATPSGTTAALPVAAVTPAAAAAPAPQVH